MPPDPLILAFDTSAAHCAAALLCGDQLLAQCREEMTKGQAERLFPMIENLLKSQNLGWKDISLLAVGIGPGNFTGVRISVSAARGLALSLGVPAIGISTFEVMRDPNRPEANSAELVSIEAPKQSAYVQLFQYGQSKSPPQQIDPASPPEDFARESLIVRGYRAAEIAHKLNARYEDAALQDVAQRVAIRAHWRVFQMQESPGRPTPLYARAPDAAPPRQSAPVILP